MPIYQSGTKVKEEINLPRSIFRSSDKSETKSDELK